MELILLFVVFIIYSIVREIIYWKQLKETQSLIKAKDLTDYYKSKGVVSEQVNAISKEEPNMISLDETSHFELPSEFKVQWEDESAIQTVKIYK